MKKSIKEYKDLVLQPGKVVTVKPIKRRKPYLKKGHDGEDIYTGCHKDITLHYDTGKRSYTSPFTEDKEAEEQEAFEVLLNQKENSLNLYEYKVTEPNFWGEFRINVPKEGLKLDLGSPKDVLMYRVLSVDPKVATDSRQRAVHEKIFEIIDNKKEEQVATVLSKKKSKAQDYMYKAKKSRKDLIDTLRLLGKKVDPKSDKDWLEGELFKIVDEVAVQRGTAGIDKFITVMEDSARDTKLFVLDAIEGQEIVRDGNGYKIADTNQFLGRKYEEVVQYFLSKDPKIQEAKLIIQERIK